MLIALVVSSSASVSSPEFLTSYSRSDVDNLAILISLTIRRRSTPCVTSLAWHHRCRNLKACRLCALPAPIPVMPSMNSSATSAPTPLRLHSSTMGSWSAAYWQHVLRRSLRSPSETIAKLPTMAALDAHTACFISHSCTCGRKCCSANTQSSRPSAAAVSGPASCTYIHSSSALNPCREAVLTCTTPVCCS